MTTLLQIIPRLPGAHEGVGDYALNLARKLREAHDIETTFAVFRDVSAAEVDGFRATSLRNVDREYENVLLHYVNYAYQARGVPFLLRNVVRELHRHVRGRWLTLFHELYASGAPWKSAFWLRPWQVKIARQLIELSDICFVSNLPIAREIQRHDPSKPIRLIPIMSAFGEPQLTGFDRSPHRWTICGGTALIARSLRSLARRMIRIPQWCFPEQLDLIGGRDGDQLAHALEILRSSSPKIRIRRFAEVPAEYASNILVENGFAWLDYFGSGRVWSGMIFKSGSFGACCAHGLVPVFAHEEPPLGISGDLLPGPFFIIMNQLALPEPDQVAELRAQFFHWYHRHASIAVTAATYAEVLS